MAHDRIKGALKQISGGFKRAVGKVTGQPATQARGTAEAAVGKAQDAYGKVKSKVRKARVR